jgi:hypothetical protein
MLNFPDAAWSRQAKQNQDGKKKVPGIGKGRHRQLTLYPGTLMN